MGKYPPQISDKCIQVTLNIFNISTTEAIWEIIIKHETSKYQGDPKSQLTCSWRNNGRKKRKLIVSSKYLAYITYPFV
jgi:hypothetical protein